MAPHSDSPPDLATLVAAAMADYRAAIAAVDIEESAVMAAEYEHAAACEARTVLQGIARTVQQQAHTRLSGVVTRCLAATFEDPYTFEMVFENKRGQTETIPVFRRNGHTITDPMNQAGGGVIDVAAFALRLGALVLSRPARRRVVCMDEPFRFMSVALLPRLRGMLHTLSVEMGIQFIITTHSNELVAGHVVQIGE